jgi:glycosyltransferase involved in cell wall biosynthesis
MHRRSVLAVCYEFPPQLLAGAIWTGKLLGGLRDLGWDIEVVTAAEGGTLDGVTVHHVPNPGRRPLVALADRLRLPLVREWLVFPDEADTWVPAAIEQARRLLVRRPDLLVNFVMPYGAGKVGPALKRQTGLPLVYCFSDSHSCTDMHSHFPSWFHYRQARRLEDECVQQSDAAVYVSRFNAELVRSRQPPAHQDKFHTIRLGAEPDEFAPRADVRPTADGTLRIVYIGTMGGWYEWYTSRPVLSAVRGAVESLGRYRLTRLDHSTHTPVYVGRAVQKVIEKRPEWRGRIHVELYGAYTAPPQQVRKVLEATGLAEVVRVHGPVSRDEVCRQTRQADLLFHGVQDRADGSPGGRIASKTYEYLMTDRPILAAVPPGENWDYYQGRPGVWLVRPADVEGMARAIEEAAQAKLVENRFLDVDRSALRDELTYANRARQLEGVLLSVLAARTPASVAACSK